MPAIESHTI